ncbi:type II toxin-antitoxin system VapC family toxin [bacterium]|nr:MAG: type II toxin-antitoxin system VapC family toxin [bacterium]
MAKRPKFYNRSILALEDIWEGFELVSLTPDLARLASGIRRQHRLKLADAIVVATALDLGLPLYTSDRQLSRVDSLTVIEAITPPAYSSHASD